MKRDTDWRMLKLHPRRLWDARLSKRSVEVLMPQHLAPRANVVTLRGECGKMTTKQGTEDGLKHFHRRILHASQAIAQTLLL